MTLERYLRLIAGSFVLISAFLAWAVSPWFLLFTAFVGVNLIQSAFSNRCPMISLLRKFRVREESGQRPAAKLA
ncbi:MAG TPA: DUF2892 domain-containing protein [Thermoanaerobaculia bacterium]